MAHGFSIRLYRVAGCLAFLVVVLAMLSGCNGGTRQDLEATKTQLSSSQAELKAAQDELAQVRSAEAAMQAQLQDQKSEKSQLTLQVNDLKHELAAKDQELAELKTLLEDTQAELEDVKFAADRLLSQAEAALQKEDLKEAQRIANLLAKEHAETPQAGRAADIVGLIEKSLAEKAAEDAKRIAAATARMKSETDEVRGVTFYKDQSTPDPALDSTMYMYIGKKDDEVWPRLYYQYHSDDWLFITSITVKAGDQLWEITPESNEWERDNSAYSVWEWYDGPVGRSGVEMVKAVIASDNAVIRFNGDAYYSDHVVTPEEKLAMQNVLDAFVAFGGNLDNP